MKRVYLFSVAVLVCVIATMPMCQASDGALAWLPEDSVAMRQFDTETGVAISPNATKIFFVSYHGDVQCDCNIYDLDIFSVKAVQRALQQNVSSREQPLKPERRLFRRSWSRKGRAIQDAQWGTDSASIFFQGPDERGLMQLYRFDLRSGNVAAITDWVHTVDAMDRTEDTVFAELALPNRIPPPVYPFHPLTQTELMEALSPEQGADVDRTFVSYRRRKSWEVTLGSYVYGFEPVFSKNGKKVIQTRVLEKLPAGWKAYDRSWVTYAGGTLVLIDAQHKTTRKLFDAPTGLDTRVGYDEARMLGPLNQDGVGILWAEDQRHVVLINTALPLTPGHPERAHMAYIVGYDTNTNTWSIIEPLQTNQADGSVENVSQVGWLVAGKELFVGHTVAGIPVAGTVYTLRGGRWMGRSADAKTVLPSDAISASSSPPHLPAGLSIALHQNQNDPPIMIASEGRHQRILTDPDPVLKNLSWLPTNPFSWKEPSGKLETGGLVLPRNASKAVPLVIQGYYYDPDSFLPQGIGYPGYAAQSLAARGIAVLSMPIPLIDDRQKVISTPGFELNEYMQRIDSAIDALAIRKIIDRTRVGLIGFSRGGFMVRYAITHPGKSPPAAVVMEDSFQGDYSSYLTDGACDFPTTEFMNDYGESFWENKTSWLENETTFNIDRVQTPALYELHKEGGIGAFASTVGAFRLNHRPLDFLIYPDAPHELTMPRQRLASEQTSVDWMAYWLLGQIPPDPATATRWAKLRTEQEEVLSELKAKGKDVTPLPPLVTAPSWATRAHTPPQAEVSRLHRVQ